MLVREWDADGLGKMVREREEERAVLVEGWRGVLAVGKGTVSCWGEEEECSDF